MVFDKTFIKQAKKTLEPYREDWYQTLKEHTWIYQNPEKRKECINRYAKTEKGRRAGKRRLALRKRREKDGIEKLSPLEKHQIAQFYRDCPPDHEVDHIIPLSKGGKHILVNLQYLSREENRKKGARILTMYKCDFKASWSE